MRLSLCALLLAIPAFVLAQDTEPTKKTKPREITVKLAGSQGRFAEPTKITNKEELEKAVSDKETQKEILKQVDLKNEFLVLFSWSGSGQDKVAMEEDKGKVTFKYTPGLTRDLRTHAKLFALPAKTEYKVGK